MSRINFPKRFLEKFLLLEKVNQKHVADGVGSVLTPYFTEEGIVWADDLTAGGDAVSRNNEFSALEKLSELKRNQRDIAFDRVFKEHRECVQFLKALYRANVHLLGDWGVTVDGDNRISYPVDFLEKTVAVNNFIDQYNTYGPGLSPLEPFIVQHSIDLTQSATDTSDAINFNNDFLANSEEKENKREQRDNLFAPVEDHLHGIGQFLVNLFNDNPQNAGLWGFVIDSSPQSEIIRTFTISSGEIKTITNVALESKVKNVGATTLLIRKGTDDDTPPVALIPNQEFTIVRGYGKMIVENESIGEEGSIKATLHR